MASLSTCHLGIWLGWQILLNLVKKLTSTRWEFEPVHWAVCVPHTNWTTRVELGHWTQERLATVTFHWTAFVDQVVDITTVWCLATNGRVWCPTVTHWNRTWHIHGVTNGITTTCDKVGCLKYCDRWYGRIYIQQRHVMGRISFDKVWYAALWATMRKYNIGSELVRTIEHLYDNATSAVIFNSSIGDWFRTTVGVRQGCLLSPTLFNIFLERIMTDALGNHQGTVSIGGRTITNLRFADDIDGLAGDEQHLANLVERLEKTSTSYGMEISAEKTKLMTNNTKGISKEVKVNGQRLRE